MRERCSTCGASLLPTPGSAQRTGSCARCGATVAAVSSNRTHHIREQDNETGAFPWLPVGLGAAGGLLVVVLLLGLMVQGSASPEVEIVQPQQPAFAVATPPGVPGPQDPGGRPDAGSSPNAGPDLAGGQGHLPTSTRLTPVSPTGVQGGGKRLPGQMVTFLGSEAVGKRFCIIADASGSMSRALGDLKNEVIRTLRSLNSDSQFHVIFFGSRSVSMPGGSWLRGEQDVDQVVSWIQQQRTLGGTVPGPAFDLAFQLQPRPDVIFFMTDGGFAKTVPSQVKALNSQEPRTVINTIQFVFSGTAKANPARVNLAPNRLLETIASENAGTFRFYHYAPTTARPATSAPRN